MTNPTDRLGDDALRTWSDDYTPTLSDIEEYDFIPNAGLSLETYVHSSSSLPISILETDSPFSNWARKNAVMQDVFALILTINLDDYDRYSMDQYG